MGEARGWASVPAWETPRLQGRANSGIEVGRLGERDTIPEEVGSTS